MSGAPREAYAPRHFIMVSMVAVKELGSWEAAGCFQRIGWRAERDGYWRATMKEIADEIGVSERTAKRITQKLRDLGWVTAERENPWEATLTWRVVLEGDTPESDTVAPSEAGDETAGQDTEGQADTLESDTVSPSGVPDVSPSGVHPEAPSGVPDVALTSLETNKTKNKTNNVSEADASTRRDLNEGREDVDRLVEHLSKRLTEREVRHTITKAWRDAARLMLDTDGRSEAQVHNMIEWSQDSEFWRPNIHSMPKLREKYDQMREQALRGHSDNVRPIRTVHHSGDESERQRMIDALNG